MEHLFSAAEPKTISGELSTLAPQRTTSATATWRRAIPGSWAAPCPSPRGGWRTPTQGWGVMKLLKLISADGTVKHETWTSNSHWRECAIITLWSRNLYLKIPLMGMCYHALAIDCPIPRHFWNCNGTKLLFKFIYWTWSNYCTVIFSSSTSFRELWWSFGSFGFSSMELSYFSKVTSPSLHLPRLHRADHDRRRERGLHERGHCLQHQGRGDVRVLQPSARTGMEFSVGFEFGIVYLQLAEFGQI